MDLSKAFDCVEHSLLLNKLERYGFRGTFLSIMKSYLEYRVQSVDTGAISNELQVSHGVPQGSVLGPLLFILYINDIYYILPHLHKTLYADDTVILKSGFDITNLVNNLNSDFQLLADWMNFNKLAINVTKSKCMIFSFRNINAVPPVKISNMPLEYVKEIKYLGLVIDDRLSFKQHIICLKSKLACYQGLIYSLKPYLSLEALKSIYYTCIFSHLLMHISVWGGTAPTHLNLLQVAQNKIIRTMYNNDFTSTDNIFKRLNIIKVAVIYDLQCLIFMYKWIKFNRYPFLAEMREEASLIPIHQTRSAGNMRLPFPRLNVHRQTAIYNGLQLWNQVDESIKEAPSIASFKKRIKSLF